LITLPDQDNEALRISNGFYDQPTNSGANIFAEAVSCYIDCEHTGTWESTKDGSLIWRQRRIL